MVPEDELRKAVCSHIAKLLKEEREERGLSMTKLSEQAGLSRAMISHIEHEIRNPTLDTLLRICAAMNIELADLLTQANAAVSKSGRSTKSSD